MVGWTPECKPQSTPDSVAEMADRRNAKYTHVPGTAVEEADADFRREGQGRREGGGMVPRGQHTLLDLVFALDDFGRFVHPVHDLNLVRADSDDLCLKPIPAVIHHDHSVRLDPRLAPSVSRPVK